MCHRLPAQCDWTALPVKAADVPGKTSSTWFKNMLTSPVFAAPKGSGPRRLAPNLSARIVEQDHPAFLHQDRIVPDALEVIRVGIGDTVQLALDALDGLHVVRAPGAVVQLEVDLAVRAHAHIVDRELLFRRQRVPDCRLDVDVAQDAEGQGEDQLIGRRCGAVLEGADIGSLRVA